MDVVYIQFDGSQVTRSRIPGCLPISKMKDDHQDLIGSQKAPRRNHGTTGARGRYTARADCRLHNLAANDGGVDIDEAAKRACTAIIRSN